MRWNESVILSDSNSQTDLFVVVFSGIRTLDIFLVLFGLQVIRDGIPQPIITVSSHAGTAVHVLFCTWYLFSSIEALSV